MKESSFGLSVIGADDMKLCGAYPYSIPENCLRNFSILKTGRDFCEKHIP